MNNINNFLSITVQIFGGLAIFLFSMTQLSNGLQTIIGSKIEEILRKLTNRPYKGMVVGTLVTFLAQSSSITVLTVIGLVNAGILKFSQGIGILLGSEIGTTITAQLVTFKLGNAFYPLIILGFIISNLDGKKLKSLGKVVFSFGLLFMGMELMKNGAVPIRESERVIDMFTKFGNWPILGILIGTIFTAITSSSSATTSLVVALGASSTITLPTAIALILGANIGTTILELIAVKGMSIAPKRIAIAQALMNIIGIIIILPFLRPFANLISLTSADLSHQIANSHTIFNIASSLLFLPLVNQLTRLCVRIVPGKVVKIDRGIKYLEPHLLKMPYIAITNTIKEITRMGKIVQRMLNHMNEIVEKERSDLIEIISIKESNTDFLYLEISKYLMKISENELAPDASQKISRLAHGIADIERAADHLRKAAKYLKEKEKRKFRFSGQTSSDLLNFLKKCQIVYGESLRSFLLEDRILAVKVADDMEKVKEQKKKLLVKFSKLSYEKQRIYSQIINHIERTAHHGENLAHIVVEGV